MRRMADLWQHPETKTYYFRRGIPAALRAFVQRGREWKVSLRTKDRAEARSLFLKEADRCEEEFTRARASVTAGPHHLTPRHVAEIGAAWLASALAKHNAEVEADAGHDDAGYGLILDDLHDISRRTAAGRAKAMHGDVAALLAELRLRLEEDSRGYSLLADELIERKRELMEILIRRARGDYRAGLEAEQRQEWSRPSDPTKTMRWAFDEWVKARKPAQRTAYEFERYVIEFGPKRLVQEITPEDVRTYRDTLAASGTTANYVDKKLQALRSVFKWLMRENHLKANPATGVGVANLKQDRQRQKRDGYTREEATKLLRAARKEEGALRWLPWILGASGCRMHEVCQAFATDVAKEDGVWRLSVSDVAEGQGLKTEASRRKVPLHPDLIAEGFLDYVATLPKGSRLFPEATPNKVGNWGAKLGQRYGRWLRTMIADPRKVAHSWRHSFATWAREADIGEEKADALTGHQQPGRVGRGYGVVPLKTLATAITKIDFGAPPSVPKKPAGKTKGSR
jgi:integrase